MVTTELKNGGSFHGELLNNQRVVNVVDLSSLRWFSAGEQLDLIWLDLLYMVDILNYSLWISTMATVPFLKLSQSLRCAHRNPIISGNWESDWRGIYQLWDLCRLPFQLPNRVQTKCACVQVKHRSNTFPASRPAFDQGTDETSKYPYELAGFKPPDASWARWCDVAGVRPEVVWVLPKSCWEIGRLTWQ